MAYYGDYGNYSNKKVFISPEECNVGHVGCGPTPLESSIFDCYASGHKSGGGSSSNSGGWVKDKFNYYIDDCGMSKYNWTPIANTADAIKKSQNHLVDLIRYYEGDATNNYKAKTEYDDAGGVKTMGYGITKLSKFSSKPPKTETEAYEYMLTYMQTVSKDDCIKVLGKERFDKLPNSVREAMLDFAFKSGRPVMLSKKANLVSNIDSQNWSKLLEEIYYTKDSKKVDKAGLHRRALSRVILATRDLPQTDEIKNTVARLYDKAVVAFKKEGKPLQELEEIYNTYRKNTSNSGVSTKSQVSKKSNAEVKTYKIQKGEGYLAAVKAFYPEITDYKEKQRIAKQLENYNGKPNDKLSAGDVIKPLPSRPVASSKVETKPTRESNAEVKTYKIQKGEGYLAAVEAFYPEITDYKEKQKIAKQLEKYNGKPNDKLSVGDVIKPLPSRPVASTKVETKPTETTSQVSTSPDISNAKYLKIRRGVREINGKDKPVVIPSRHVFESKNKNGPLKGETIIVNAGHGYGRYGNMVPGTLGLGGLPHEYLINYKNAMILADKLTAQGARVIYLQGDEGSYSKDLAVVSKDLYLNENKADLFISLHVNAQKKPPYNAAGVSFHCSCVSPSKVGGEEVHLNSLALASSVSGHFSPQEEHGSNGGIVTQSLQVCLHAENNNMPALLIETGYMTHPEDRKKLDNPKYQESYMDRVCKGVIDYYENIEKFEFYCVKKGDSLGKIAKKYGILMSELKEINEISGNNIDVGQVLKIPKKR